MRGSHESHAVDRREEESPGQRANGRANGEEETLVGRVSARPNRKERRDPLLSINDALEND